MAAMIDAKEAKRILGCDDDALNGHINSGAIRARRENGRLMLDRGDVDKVASGGGAGDEDSIIVLTGESDHLQIDLGAEAPAPVKPAAGPVDSGPLVLDEPELDLAGKDGAAQTLSFGAELEVVSVDDGKNTESIATVAGADTGAGSPTFTDSNTVVMTSVDDTSSGLTSIEATTGATSGAASRPNGNSATSSVLGGRNVRSNRARVEVAPVSPWTVGVLAASLVVILLLVAPVLAISLAPTGERGRDGSAERGVDDGLWSKMAGGLAGFSVEPVKARAGDSFADIKAVDPQASWRHQDYRGGSAEDREAALTIVKVSPDGKTAFARKQGIQYQVRDVRNGEVTEPVVDIGLAAK